MCSNAIDQLRAEIDRLDEQLLGILARRLSCARLIQLNKQLQGRPARSPERESIVMKQARDQAERYGLDQDLVEGVFAHLFAASRRYHPGDTHETI